MNILDIEDQLLDEAFEKEWISNWDYTFMQGLIDYPNLSEKQDAKAQAILRKIERGLERQDKAKAQAEQDGDFKQAIENYQQSSVCPHCGR